MSRKSVHFNSFHIKATLHTNISGRSLHCIQPCDAHFSSYHLEMLQQQRVCVQQWDGHCQVFSGKHIWLFFLSQSLKCCILASHNIYLAISSHHSVTLLTGGYWMPRYFTKHVELGTKFHIYPNKQPPRPCCCCLLTWNAVSYCPDVV